MKKLHIEIVERNNGITNRAYWKKEDRKLWSEAFDQYMKTKDK